MRHAILAASTVLFLAACSAQEAESPEAVVEIGEGGDRIEAPGGRVNIGGADGVVDIETPDAQVYIDSAGKVEIDAPDANVHIDGTGRTDPDALEEDEEAEG